MQTDFFFFFAKDAGVAGSRWASQRYSFLFPERGRSCMVRQHIIRTAPILRRGCSSLQEQNAHPLSIILCSGAKPPPPLRFPPWLAFSAHSVSKPFSCLPPDPNTTPDRRPQFLISGESLMRTAHDKRGDLGASIAIGSCAHSVCASVYIHTYMYDVWVPRISICNRGPQLDRHNLATSGLRFKHKHSVRIRPPFPSHISFCLVEKML